MFTIGITGLRPAKLPGGYNWTTKYNMALLNLLKKKFTKIVNDHKDEEILFVTGGALGCDQMAFFIIENIREEYPNVKIEMAIPFKYHFNKWTLPDIRRYRHQLACTDIRTYVNLLPEYNKFHTNKYILRNMYIVDKSNYMIGIWDGTAGGTAGTVKYAHEKNVPIDIIDPRTI